MQKGHIYLLNQEMLDDFNSIYLQKPIELLGQIF